MTDRRHPISNRPPVFPRSPAEASRDDVDRSADHAADVVSFVRWLRAGRRSPETIDSYRRSVSQFFAFADAQGMPTSPLSSVRREHVEASDSELQPNHMPCSGDWPCEMCGGPCPDPHIHVYERSDMLDDPLPGEPQFGYTAEAWDELRDSVRHVGEQLGAHPTGCCSEGCAMRFVAGERAVFELGGLERGEPGTAERDRYWQIRSRWLPSQIVGPP